MAYTKFKPQIWSSYILKELKADSCLIQHSWDQFSGEAKLGSTIHIHSMEKPTIKKYVPGTDIDSPETYEGIRTTLNIDQYDYFNFTIDDVDKAQTGRIDLMKDRMKESKEGLLESAEAYIAKLAASASHKSAAAAITNAAEAKAAIDKALVALRKLNVTTKTEVFIELPVFLYYLFKDYLIEAKTSNDKLAQDGTIGMYDGCKVVMCNNLYVNGGTHFAMLRTRKAISYANSIEEIIPYSPEKRFSDAIKGLHVYGAAITRPDELFVIQARETV